MIKKNESRLFWLEEALDDGRIALFDNVNHIMTRAKWLELKAEMQALYATVTDEEIQQYNQQIDEELKLYNDKMMKEIRIDSDELLDDDQSGFVYIICAKQSGRYKIGVTKQPETRIEQLGRQSPFELTFAFLHTTSSIYFVESQLHERFDAWRKHGEWFQLSDKELDVVVEYARKMIKQS